MSFTFLLIFSVLTFLVAFAFDSVFIKDDTLSYLENLKIVLWVSTSVMLIVDGILIATHIIDCLL